MADSDRAWDAWVRGALADAYAPVAQEQLPAEWMALIEARCRD